MQQKIQLAVQASLGFAKPVKKQAWLAKQGMRKKTSSQKQQGKRGPVKNTTLPKKTNLNFLKIIKNIWQT